MNKIISFASVLSLFLIFIACKKEKEEEKEEETKVILEKRCYPTECEIETDDKTNTIKLEYNSDGLLEKVKAYENDEYELKYGFYKKLESITYKWDGDLAFLERFYYNSDGILVEMHTYSYYENKNVFNNKRNLPTIEKLRKATLRAKGKEKFLTENGIWVLSMMHKYWLNEDVLPDKIEDISSINEKMSEIDFSYDSDGNIEKEERYQMNQGTGELELKIKIKTKFDDKKSPGFDFKNVCRFTLLADVVPYTRHSINNAKERTVEIVDADETSKYTYKNKYNDDDYLVSSTSDKEIEKMMSEKITFEYDCKEEEVEE